MSAEIVWTSDGNIREGKLEELRALLSGAAENVRANEPGTLTYQFFISEDGKRFDSLERYADSAAALTHVGGFGEIAEAFMACVELKAIHVYGDPSDELRAALADFHPHYWRSFGGFRR